jgi:hypothetical protein
MNATNPALAALTTRIDLIEEAYEYMLAYAAQGFEKDTDSHGPSIRDCLTRFERGLVELEQPAHTLLGSSNAGFVEVLTHDASATIAAFKLVLSCRTISSQLIDNLNGSVHLRALLTDLFVIDEYVKITYGIVAEPIDPAL